MASIQPRTSLVKFARSPRTDPPGDFQSVTVKKKKQLRSGQWKAYGFANFKTHADAARALEILQAKDIVITDDEGGRWVVNAEWAHKSERFEATRREKQVAADKKLKNSSTSKR